MSAIHSKARSKRDSISACDGYYATSDPQSLEESLEPSLCYNETALGNQSDIEAFYDQYLGSHLETRDSSSYNDESELLLFQTLPIEQWSGEDCYDWAISVCQKRGLDPSDVNLWNLQTTTGSAMLQFSLQHFCLVAGNLHGSVFYQDFQTIRKSKKKAMKHSGRQNQEEEESGNSQWRSSNGGRNQQACAPLFHSFSSSTPSTSSSSSSPLHESLSPLSPASSSASRFALTSTDSWELSKEEFQELDRYIPKTEEWGELPEDLLNMDLKDYRNSLQDEEEDNPEYEADASDSYKNFDLSYLSYSSSSDIANSAVKQKVKTTSRKGERNPKIWEFLMRLLLDEATNPDLIRWDDKSKATFILTQPAIIAHLWGARANKPNLSANNFARALRYHYNTGALVAVSEKHYMYKCGPKALRYLIELQTESSSSSSISSDDV